MPARPFDWDSYRYPPEMRKARRAEVVFYCFLRGQDLKLDHQECYCSWWLGNLIAEKFSQEKD